MLKKTIKYKDYNGVERTEDFYFNLTKAEIAEMEMSRTGGLANYINKIVAAEDQTQLVPLFKEVILKSYGVKSEDGRRFMKNPEIVAEFAETEAYSELFMELATNAEAAAAFINGVVPQM